jgi:hypothetical protein
MLKGVYYLILLILALLLITACGGEPEPTETPTPTPTPLPTDTPVPTPTEVSPPEVIIEDPLSNATAVVGEQVLIQSTATDEIGISRVELQVDGALVRSDNTPEETPLTRYSLLQAWEPAAVGEHSIRVTAFRADGTPSEPAGIIILVEEGDPAAVETGPQPCSATASTNLNVRQGPGIAYGRVGVLAMGENAPVTGKVDNGSWWQIDFQGTPSWIAASHSYPNGDCETAPIVAAPPPPPAAPTHTPTPSITPGGPTLTPSPTTNASVTATYTPTPSPTPTQPTNGQATATYTATPTYTPTATEPTNGQATSTYTPSPTTQATPTYTPTSPPAAQVAPSDANFNNPLNIPLDNTASVLDFVSYPGGDTQDRVRWDITGMNPNVSLSGGRARLVLAVSCFGTGIENVQFFTGGQTYFCGQTIVDQEVTYDSRTGQVTITAVGGENTYVQWVLTGTATRVN